MREKKIKEVLANVSMRKLRRGKQKAPTALTPDQVQVHSLFVLQGKTQSECAQLTGISQSTISKWVSLFSWADEREARNLSPMQIYSTVMISLAEVTKRLKNLDWDGDADGAKKEFASLMDSISKANSVGRDIIRSYDSLGGIILAVDEFVHWLEHSEIRKKHHPDLLTILDQYIPAFSRDMAEKYK